VGVGTISARRSFHLASKIFHGGLEAAASVRDVQRAERHLDRTEHAVVRKTFGRSSRRLCVTASMSPA
jgi:hypothetical protein